jgi:glucose uptake protein GlcU
MHTNNHQNAPKQAATNLLVGFFGVLGAIFILPRALRFVGKRFAFSFISEIVMIVLTGLLTEKLVSKVAGENDHADEHAMPPRRPVSY